MTLPTGWRNATLKALCQSVPSVDPTLAPEREFGYVDIGCIDNLRGRIRETRRFLGKEAPSRARRPIKPGDVLFSNVRTYLRNIARVTETLDAELCSTGFTVLRPVRELDGGYLYHYIRSEAFIGAVTPEQTGTHYPATSDRVVLSQNIPLPPTLDEQRRIAKLLDHIASRLDDTKARLDTLPATLKRFRMAVLAAACSGRLTADWRQQRGEFDDWATIPLGDIFQMRNGKSLTVTNRVPGDIPVFGGNGLMGTHNASNVDGQIIVVGRVGAQCGNVLYTSGKAWVTDNAISLQAKIELRPAFYAFFLRSMNLNQLSGGTGQPYVSQEILSPIQAPVVSVAEQSEVVRRVDGLLKQADAIEARYRQARAFVDKLMPAALAKAFRGELL